MLSIALQKSRRILGFSNSRIAKLLSKGRVVFDVNGRNMIGEYYGESLYPNQTLRCSVSGTDCHSPTEFNGLVNKYLEGVELSNY